MSEQESRPTQSGGAAPEEFADSGPQITIAEQRTILLDDARKHRKHVRAAHEFAAQWLGKLLYVVGIGWHHWDGKRWAEDQGGTRAKAAAMETLKAMWGLALGDKDLASDVMACSTASGVRGGTRTRGVPGGHVRRCCGHGRRPLPAQLRERDARPAWSGTATPRPR